MSDPTVPAIREWFERHRHDYCSHHQAPPLVWSEYFERLLHLLDQQAAEGQALREERDQLRKDLEGLLGSAVPEDAPR